MRFLAGLFGRMRHVDATNRHVDAACVPASLQLPPRSSHVVDWSPPPARHVPHALHVEALIRLFQEEGQGGHPVPHWDLTASYPEVAWVSGYHQISERQLLCALSQVCAKIRLAVDRGDGILVRASCYVIPSPEANAAPANPTQPPGRVVVFRKASPRIAAQKGIQGSKRNSASLPKSGWPGRGAYRADIGQAVANG